MRNLRNLSLGDLKLGLDDLFDTRHAALVASKVGKTYESMLSERRARIDALPSALLGGLPLATELANADLRHDGFGGAIWFLTEAFLRWPDVPEETAAAARRIREAFVPDLQGLQASFATEANAAKKRRKLVATYKADLKLFPVQGKKTLYTWVKEHLAAGERLGVLLSERAGKSTGDRSEVSKIRPSTIALLNRLRGALSDELAHDAKLSRTLDTEVFAFFDQLETARARSGSGAAPAPPAPTPPGPAPSAPAGGSGTP